MLCDCVTWSPRACHYETLCRAHHRFLTRWIGWRKHNRADHPISYLDTLIKTGSESIEATLRSKRILFAGFVMRMEDTKLPKCLMFGELVGGVGCVQGQEKERMGCFLDDLRASGINIDQWITAAQDDGEWRRTAEQGALGETTYHQQRNIGGNTRDVSTPKVHVNRRSEQGLRRLTTRGLCYT